MRKLRVAEIYAGIARTWEPFRQWRRCELGLLVDLDSLARDTYTDNFPRAPYWKRDLTWVRPDELEAQAGGKVDILLGCPPCQGFSDTGKRDPNDPRNAHIDVFARFVCGLGPRAVVMENVPLLAGSARYRRFTRRLEKAGYRWTAAVVNAALYGSCQTRQRLVLVAVRKGAGLDPELPAPTHGGGCVYFGYQSQKLIPLKHHHAELLGITPAAQQLQAKMRVISEVGQIPIPTLGDTLDGLPVMGSTNAVCLSHEPWQTSATMRRRMSFVNEGGRWKGGQDHYSHAYGRLHRRGLSRTITTYFANPGSGRFWHPVEDRPLSVREAARIQGIDDNLLFQGSLSGAARLVGNALDGAIAEVGYQAVRRALE